MENNPLIKGKTILGISTKLLFPIYFFEAIQSSIYHDGGR